MGEIIYHDHKKSKMCLQFLKLMRNIKKTLKSHIRSAWKKMVTKAKVEIY